METAEDPKAPEVLSEAPEELTRGRLKRIGEGIGRVVYASEHWVVKRERSPFDVVALVVVWRLLRQVTRLLPSGLARRLNQRPARQIRLLRVMMQGVMLIIPRGIWFSTHIRGVWSLYHRRNVRGAKLAQTHLAGTALIPEQVTFPPTSVRVGGWPGWIIVSQAEERAESTLYHRLLELSRAGHFEEIEWWLERLIELRVSGWQHGLFSMDAHLKNFGLIGERLFLLDTGGLTNRWSEIERRLAFEKEVEQPHKELGLGALLAPRPDIARRFDDRWKATVNLEVVRQHWKESQDI